MDDNSTKRCPQCGGDIDYFGSCRRCGREWSEHLEEDEKATGVPEGEHPSIKKVGTRKPRKNRFTKSKPSMPTKYAGWMIDDSDDETEIIRKRSLMHFDSRKTYNAMGLSMRAHDAQKGALLWLTRLWEFLSEDEQKALAPTMGRLKQSFAELRAVSQTKIAEAAEMELALEKAHSSARKARFRLIEAGKRKKARNIKPGEDTEGLSTPEPVILDPKLLEDPRYQAKLTKEDLLALAKAKLANLDQEKVLRKRGERPLDEDPTNSE